MAEQVEAEQSEFEAPAGVEPEPDEPEPDEPESDEPDEPTAAALPSLDPKKFEAEQKRHESALEKLFASDWEAMTHCENCGGVGFLPRSLAQLPDMQPDPSLVVCDACVGFGSVTTPSLNPDRATEVCTACAGRGYETRGEREARTAAAAYHAQPIPTYAPSASSPQLHWNPQAFTWETPDGKPVYGLEPPPVV